MYSLPCYGCIDSTAFVCSFVFWGFSKAKRSLHMHMPSCRNHFSEVGNVDFSINANEMSVWAMFVKL